MAYSLRPSPISLEPRPLGQDMDQTPTDCDKTLAAQIDSISTWYARGDALARMERYSEALACFNTVLEIDNTHCESWIFRAVVLIHLQRYQDALASCERALAIQPNHSEAWLFRGVAFYYLNRYQDAYTCYDRALGLQRRSPWQRLSQALKQLYQRFIS